MVIQKKTHQDVAQSIVLANSPSGIDQFRLDPLVVFLDEVHEAVHGLGFGEAHLSGNQGCLFATRRFGRMHESFACLEFFATDERRQTFQIITAFRADLVANAPDFGQ